MLTKNRLHFIDALRGLAALYVVIFHIVRAPEFHLPLPSWLRPFIGNGSSGVALFFILSGFTLCYTFHPKMNQPGALKNFYIRRFFRIAPLYYAMLIFMIILVLLLDPAYINGKGILLYSTFTFNLVPNYQAGLIPASWTIGIEMLFYLVFPFIFTRFANLKGSVLLLTISSALTSVLLYFEDFFPTQYIFYFFLTNLPLFVAGFVCYFIFLREFTLPSWWLIVALLFVILVPYLVRSPSFFVMAPFYALLIITLGKQPMKLICNPITTFYGTLSYSVYLLHPKLVTASGKLYEYFSNIGYNYFATYLCCIAITLIPLTMLAWLTYHFIEKPGIDFGHRLSRKI